MTSLLEAARNILTWVLSDEGTLNLQSMEVNAPDQHEIGYHLRQARMHVLNALELLKKY